MAGNPFTCTYIAMEASIYDQLDRICFARSNNRHISQRAPAPRCHVQDLYFSSPLCRRHFSLNDTMTCWFWGGRHQAVRTQKSRYDADHPPKMTHLGPSLAPWLYIMWSKPGNGRAGGLLVGGSFASRLMTDEMRGETSEGACVPLVELQNRHSFSG